MSLPAGFTITSIDGLRCTAVPRASTTLPASLATLPAATPSTTSTTSLATSTSVFSSDAQPNAAGASAAPTSTTAAQVASTSIVSTPVASFITSTSAVVLSTSATSAIPSASAIPASRITTPTTSSSSIVAIALSEVSASTTVLSTNNGNGFVDPSKTTSTSSTSTSLTSTSHPEESSATSGISSNPQVTAAPVVGGVVGSVALIAMIGMIFYFLRKRRRGRESLLTPLTTGRRSSFYDADIASVGPSGRGGRWRSEVEYQTDRIRNVGAGIAAGIVGIGASLKSKVGTRSDSPSVNLNRGNSQFMDGAIPQHSRNNSVLSQAEKPSIKDKASEWWERLSEKVAFAWRMRMKNREPEDPFAAARSMSEKQAKMNNNPPDFSQLLRMDDRDLQLQAERRRMSLAGNTNSLPQLGSLGLNFGSVGEDPFADPVKGAGYRPPPSTNPASNPFADPVTNRSNPFADPPTRPGATIPKANTYITDIRRSRGQSIDNTTSNNHLTSMYRPPSTAIGSRFPSTIAPSRDSYRDTVFSTFSSSPRKGKGRSDPFDLERPELWKPKDTNSKVMYPSPLNPKTGNGGAGEIITSTSRINSTASYLSKYSSGVSMGEWGDPGPDLGPGSGSSSLRGNASSNGGSQDFSAGMRGYYGEPTQRSQGGAKENWDQSREKNNVSPLSRTSSKGGVGKAM